ncbi:hypothetical protein HD806DRAFT_533992 [Xylariaceae sp. AK1471]|nr:hypothetical protein HD806DRAFT_533992 [Xylariaceae sp. AK1471]
MDDSSDGMDNSSAPQFYHPQPPGSNPDLMDTADTTDTTDPMVTMNNIDDTEDMNTTGTTHPAHPVVPALHGRGRGGGSIRGSTRGRGSLTSPALHSRGRGHDTHRVSRVGHARGRGRVSIYGAGSGRGRGGFGQSAASNGNPNVLPVPGVQVPPNSNTSALLGNQLQTTAPTGNFGPFSTSIGAFTSASMLSPFAQPPAYQSSVASLAPATAGNNIASTGNLTIPGATLPLPVQLNNPNGNLIPVLMPNPMIPATFQPVLINAAGVLQVGANPVPAAPLARAGVVCVVCGGICKVTSAAIRNEGIPNWMRPTLIKAKPKYLEWRSQSFASRAYRRQDEKELIEHIHVTEFFGGGGGMRVGKKILYINTSDQLMHIPIHQACFNVAERFCKDQARYDIDFRSPDGGAPSSMAHLYEIWCKRAIATCPQGIMNKPIMEPHGYFGAPRFDDASEYNTAMQKDPSIARFVACPVVIRELTDITVTSKLQTMDGKDTYIREDLVELWSRVQDLPQELHDRIVDAMEPFEADGGPSLEPARIHPPNWWKEKLLSGQLIPWLWDLSEKGIVDYRVATFYKHDSKGAVDDQKNCTYVFDENMWDWELLCRQLAQPNVLEKGGLLEDESKQLWNRRRIWALLDTARLGHVWFPSEPEEN